MMRLCEVPSDSIAKSSILSVWILGLAALGIGCSSEKASGGDAGTGGSGKGGSGSVVDATGGVGVGGAGGFGGSGIVEAMGGAAQYQPEKLQIYLLAGQSNMEGFGMVDATTTELEKNGGLGTLSYLAENDPDTYGHLGSKGNWKKRDDVWIVNFKQTFTNPTVVSQGPLTVNFTSVSNHFGPELQFGQVVGDRYEAPILLIKTGRGNRSLAKNFLSPSSDGDTGDTYLWMIENIHKVLDNLTTYMPSYDGKGYDLAGFVWVQGINDRNETSAPLYQSNCVNLINDLRAEFNAPTMPFVLATTGNGGWSLTGIPLTLIEGQLAVPTDPGLKAGYVFTVETRGFWREAAVSPRDQSYHWNWNAESYFLIGDSMGKAMLDQQDKRHADLAKGNL